MAKSLIPAHFQEAAQENKPDSEILNNIHRSYQKKTKWELSSDWGAVETVAGGKQAI